MRLPPGVLAVGLLAFAVRLAVVVRYGGLRGVHGYDDGVYYGAADALLFGRVPYGDYLLLHPPGVLLLLSPFAAIGRLTSDPTGFALARLAFVSVGAVNAALAYRVARRLGPAAAVVAGCCYAVWEPAVYAERTTLLEPLVNLGLLLALVLLGDGRHVSRRSLLSAGAVLGLAVSVKAWAVVPLVVLLLWVAHRSGWHPAVRFAGASAAAAAAVCLPFFVLSPGPMLRMVVFDQLGRPDNGVSEVARLADMTRVDLVPGALGLSTQHAVELVSLAAVLGVAVLVLVQPRVRVWAALLAAQTALLLLSPSYFAHYSTYVAPALTLLVGAAAHEVADRLAPRGAVLFRVALAGGSALLLVGLLPGHLPGGSAFPHRQVEVALAQSRCVVADAPTSLVEADVLSRDLRRGCPLILDVTGLTYDQDPGELMAGPTPLARSHDREWQQTVLAYFRAADAVVLSRARTAGLSHRTLAAVLAHNRVVRASGYRVVR